MMCSRSIGISARRASRRRGAPSLVLGVGEAGRAVREALVLDPERVLFTPVARVPGDVGDVDELDDPPARETMKCDEACARAFCSQRTDGQNAPSVAWMTIVRIDVGEPVRLREVALAPEPDQRAAAWASAAPRGRSRRARTAAASERR